MTEKSTFSYVGGVQPAGVFPSDNPPMTTETRTIIYQPEPQRDLSVDVVSSLQGEIDDLTDDVSGLQCRMALMERDVRILETIEAALDLIKRESIPVRVVYSEPPKFEVSVPPVRIMPTEENINDLISWKWWLFWCGIISASAIQLTLTIIGR